MLIITHKNLLMKPERLYTIILMWYMQVWQSLLCYLLLLLLITFLQTSQLQVSSLWHDSYNFTYNLTHSYLKYGFLLVVRSCQLKSNWGGSECFLAINGVGNYIHILYHMYAVHIYHNITINIKNSCTLFHLLKSYVHVHDEWLYMTRSHVNDM